MKTKDLMSIDFQECVSCKGKPGMPVLCSACYHNRWFVDQLKDKIRKLKYGKGNTTKG